jgi:DNA-binding transcriptional LysR family regulator
VEGGRLDLAFMMYPLVEGPFDAAELLRDPFYLLVAEADAPARTPSLRAIADLPLIGYGPVRPELRPEARLPGVPRVVFRSNDDATIHGLVAAGVGAALLPRLSVDADYPGVRAIPLGTRLPQRRIGLAWHRDRDLPPAARAFVAAAAAAARAAGVLRTALSGGASPTSERLQTAWDGAWRGARVLPMNTGLHQLQLATATQANRVRRGRR